MSLCKAFASVGRSAERHIDGYFQYPEHMCGKKMHFNDTLFWGAWCVWVALCLPYFAHRWNERRKRGSVVPLGNGRYDVTPVGEGDAEQKAEYAAAFLRPYLNKGGQVGNTD